MTRDTRRVLVAFAVIAAVCLAVVWWLSDVNTGEQRHVNVDVPVGTVDLTHENEDLPIAAALFAWSGDRASCDKSCLTGRNRVGRWRHENENTGTAWADIDLMRGQGCRGEKDINQAWSDSMSQPLFSLWQSTTWCWQTPENKPGNFNAYNTNRGTTNGTTAWWNYWEFRGWDNPADGSGVNADGWRYRYRRNSGSFETCFLGQCAWRYDHVHVSQTVRANGTYDASIGH